MPRRHDRYAQAIAGDLYARAWAGDLRARAIAGDHLVQAIAGYLCARAVGGDLRAWLISPPGPVVLGAAVLAEPSSPPVAERQLVVLGA